jgi:hypothetical protein
MDKEKTYKPYEPTSRTQNCSLSILTDTATMITLEELSKMIGLPVDSIARAGFDLAIERYGQACRDVNDLIERSARHRRNTGDILKRWGLGAHELERLITLPKGTQRFKYIAQEKGSETN